LGGSIAKRNHRSAGKTIIILKYGLGYGITDGSIRRRKEFSLWRTDEKLRLRYIDLGLKPHEPMDAVTTHSFISLTGKESGYARRVCQAAWDNHVIGCFDGVGKTLSDQPIYLTFSFPKKNGIPQKWNSVFWFF
jgi:hypothetical protein